MNKKYSLLAGPLICAALTFILQYYFGFKSALALGTIIWMGMWWITRPVDIAVTALLPIGINAVFNLVPANQIITQYFSEIVVLLVGSDLISLTWTNTGLDKRLAIKTLCFIGTSMKQQITVWLFVSTILSIFLPNVVVAMIMVPIAVSMLHFIGEKIIKTSKIAIPILLAIVWGSGIGGFGSPLGGSANLVAISYLESICGHEFMYIDWVSRFLPFLILTMLLNLVILLSIKLPVKKLANTKAYFNDMYKQLGPMSKGEKIGLGLFIISTVLAFARPLFAEALPALRPAYIFFICGLLTFMLHDEEGKVLLTWKQAEKELMWGMFFLFAGGLALGKLVIPFLLILLTLLAADALLAALVILNLLGNQIVNIRKTVGIHLNGGGIHHTAFPLALRLCSLHRLCLLLRLLGTVPALLLRTVSCAVSDKRALR